MRLLGLDLIIATDYVVVTDIHSLDFYAFVGGDGGVIQLNQIRQRLYDKLPIKRMLCNWIVPQPKNLKLLAILQMSYFKEIRNLVLAKIEFCEVLVHGEVFQLCDFIER